ncbi:MAG TPA: hypothetical protein V6D06_14840 [Trichocoleus sp.]
MTQVCVCDRCQAPVSERHMTLTGWWHRVEIIPKLRRQNRRDEDVERHYCEACSGVLALILPLNREVPEAVREQRLRAENPNLVGLKLRRKVAPGDLQDVGCDRCGKSCPEQFARLESTWLIQTQERLTAELCPNCLPLLEAELMKDSRVA